MMNLIESYKSRFYNLLESSIGNVKPLLSEDDVKTNYRFKPKFFDDVQSLAQKFKMNLDNDVDSDDSFYKWTKDLVDNKKLVLLLYNPSEIDRDSAKVLVYVDLDGGKALKVKNGKLYFSPEKNLGTDPVSDNIDRLEKKSFLEIHFSISGFEKKLNYFIQKHVPPTKPQKPQKPKIDLKFDDLKKLPLTYEKRFEPGDQESFKLDLQNNTLTQIDYGDLQKIKTSSDFNIKNSNFKIDRPNYKVYVSKIENDDITLEGIYGSAVITRK